MYCCGRYLKFFGVVYFHYLWKIDLATERKRNDVGHRIHTMIYLEELQKVARTIVDNIHIFHFRDLHIIPNLMFSNQVQPN